MSANLKLRELEPGTAYVLSDSSGPFQAGVNDPEGMTGSEEVFACSCAICNLELATVEALWDDRTVFVCAPCFQYETGDSPEEPTR